MALCQKNKLRWISAQDGHVPPGAIAGGKEKSNPYTFIGRLSLKEKTYMGRVVPSHGSCYVICKAMEHKRRCYQVLVNPSSDVLVWRRDYLGHVPDTAIKFIPEVPSDKEQDGNRLSCNSCNLKTNPSGTSFRHTDVPLGETYYIGRTRVNRHVVIPGYIVPTHGMIHSGYDNREIVKEDYEVLCHNQPCSLKYLSAKRIRDIVRKRDRHHNAKYSTRFSNAIFNIEKIFLAMIKRVPRRRDVSEDKLELPKTLISYIRSPRLPDVSILQRLDFNTIMANCCPPEDNCCCQMWVEVTLQGLY